MHSRRSLPHGISGSEVTCQGHTASKWVRSRPGALDHARLPHRPFHGIIWIHSKVCGKLLEGFEKEGPTNQMSALESVSAGANFQETAGRTEMSDKAAVVMFEKWCGPPPGLQGRDGEEQMAARSLCK